MPPPKAGLSECSLIINTNADSKIGTLRMKIMHQEGCRTNNVQNQGKLADVIVEHMLMLNLFMTTHGLP